MSSRALLPSVLSLLLSAMVVPVAAQVPFESTGTRALGMGGAFVGVADDASATYWNPAGLPGIRFFDASLDVGRLENLERERGSAGEMSAWRTDGRRFSMAVPVLGFSYDRLTLARLEPATDGSDAGREDPQTSVVGRTLRTQHFGLTLVQSLGDAIVVGSTLRLVRAGSLAAPVDSRRPAGEILRQVGKADVDATTRFDVDLGVIGWIGRLRLGLVVRNLTAPELPVSEGEPFAIDRQARVGVSFGGEPARGQRSWAIALDADVTTTEWPGGARRSLAAGGERWWAGRRLGLRTGARVQTVDDLRPAVSGGFSVAVRSGLLIEAYGTRGEEAADRGWGLAARLTF